MLKHSTRSAHQYIRKSFFCASVSNFLASKDDDQASLYDRFKWNDSLVHALSDHLVCAALERQQLSPASLDQRHAKVRQ